MDLTASIITESQLGATGNGGNITINAGSVTIGEFGQLSSAAFGSGEGGDITINTAGALVIADNQGGYLPGPANRPDAHTVRTGISASTYFETGGDGGQIIISADSITLAGGGIESVTWGSGNGGDITLDAAGALTIRGAYKRMLRRASAPTAGPVLRGTLATSPSMPAVSHSRT